MLSLMAFDIFADDIFDISPQLPAADYFISSRQRQTLRRFAAIFIYALIWLSMLFSPFYFRAPTRFDADISPLIADCRH